MMERVVIGLGSNLGDRIGNIAAAINLLKKSLREIRVSPLYLSVALVPEGAPSSWNLEFVNGALSCCTDLEPIPLLRRLKEIEVALGRGSGERWAPRPVDLDILWYGDRKISESVLCVPHKELFNRPFALLPAADLEALPLGSPINASGVLRSFRGTSRDEPGAAWQAPNYMQRQLMRSISEGLLSDLETSNLSNGSSEIVGILNITPDSFSDGGACIGEDSAIQQSIALLKEGASIIDIGAESTRPGATSLSGEEEWIRLSEILQGLLPAIHRSGGLVSLDTRHASVAAKGLELGVDWINDVSGGRDPEMLKLVAEAGCRYVCMHSISVPASREMIMPDSEDLPELLIQWFLEKREAFVAAGGREGDIIFDPGLGFGKSAQSSWRLIKQVNRLIGLGFEVLIGHSRKSFLAQVGDLDPKGRDIETAVVSQFLSANGVDYLRVHNVNATTKAIKAAQLIRNGVLL